MVFNATFNNISIIYPEKTIGLPQVTDKLILLMDELTDHGNDPWIYNNDNSALVPDNALLCLVFQNKQPFQEV
jgi:hypothetical protein